MHLKSIRPSEVLLQEGNHNPDLYIVLTGLVGSNVRNRERREWGGMEVLGAVDLISGELWEPQRVVGIQETVVIQVKRHDLETLMYRIQSTMDHSRTLELLSQCIPGFRFLSHASKDRLSSYFHLTHFKPKSCLIPENTPVQTVYLISTGQCLETRKTVSTPTHGLASRTMNRLGIGLLGRGEWLGVDAILKNVLMECSVVAVTDMQVYSISRLDFLENMTKDTLDKLKEIVDRKNSWREERKYVMETTFHGFKEAAEMNSQPLPLASQAVKQRINQLLIQRNSRKITSENSFSVGTSANHSPDGSPARPMTSTSSLNVSFWFSQYPKQTTCSLRPKSMERKHRLPLAATLTQSLIPSISPATLRKKLRRPQHKSHKSTVLASGSVKDHFGYTAVEKPSSSYLEYLHRKKTRSPNLEIRL